MDTSKHVEEFRELVRRGVPDDLPEPPPEDPAVSRAPRRPLLLDAREKRLAKRREVRVKMKARSGI